MSFVNLNREVKVVGSYDTVVCGGGPAGWIAAVSSARAGKKTALIEKYGLNPVTIPTRPTSFCDHKRAEEITAELMESQAELLILLGDIPIAQYLKKVANIPYSTLGEYVDLYSYGNITETVINGKIVKVLPLAHPRQIGALGAHSEKWCQAHRYCENNRCHGSIFK